MKHRNLPGRRVYFTGIAFLESGKTMSFTRRSFILQKMLKGQKTRVVTHRVLIAWQLLSTKEYSHSQKNRKV